MRCQAVLKSGERCKNGAYYKLNDSSLVCGVHSRGKERQELPREPKNVEEEQKKRMEEVERIRQRNKEKKVRGLVTLSRMKMMKAIPHLDGFYSIFPNRKHGGRKDGLGIPALSPMCLGPVVLPWGGTFQNIENFHQYSKAFAEEVTDGQPNSLFWENYAKGMVEVEPHRHKPISGNGKKKPLFFVWLDKDKKVHLLDYVSSRQFYCTYYERLTLASKELHDLHEMAKNGYNINIIGYDAHSMDDVESEYLCPERPFGHERVLFTMLTKEVENWPWRKFKKFDF